VTLMRRRLSASASLLLAIGLLAPGLLLSGTSVLAAAAPEIPVFSAGGFFKLHGMIGDISAGRDLRSDQDLYIPQLPVAARPGDDDDRTHLHARTSRLWLRLQHNGPQLGPFELFAEADWLKDFDQYRPRLRHAYLKAGRLLVGRSWSTFINTQALPDIDAGIAVGASVTLLHQLRWTQALHDNLQLHVALEDPANRLHFSGTSGISVIERERPYDLALRLESLPAWGSLSFSGVWRELSVTSSRTRTADQQSTMAFSLAGRIDTGALDNLRFMFNYGDGLARHSTLGTFADAMVEADGSLDTNTGYSTLLAYQHYWTPQWRSTLAFSTARSDLPAVAAGSLTRSTSSSHLNLIWTPNLRWSLGIEYLHGWRETKTGANGELQRLQLTWRLNFQAG
jgi:hypothetical protein